MEKSVACVYIQYANSERAQRLNTNAKWRQSICIGKSGWLYLFVCIKCIRIGMCLSNVQSFSIVCYVCTTLVKKLRKTSLFDEKKIPTKCNKRQANNKKKK